MKIDYFKIERHVLVVSPLSQATTVVVSQASIVDGAISWGKNQQQEATVWKEIA